MRSTTNGSVAAGSARALSKPASIYSRWQRNRLLASALSFRDVVVVPYEHLLSRPAGGHDHCGGPIWPHWEKQRQARFNRGGSPCDVMPAGDQPRQFKSGKNYVWVGPVHSHFGHGVAEFYTRLACSLRGIERPVLVFSSSVSQPVPELAQAPRWFQGLLAWYGIPADQVLLVNEPTSFDRLVVFPQAEQLPDIGPAPAYLDLLDEISTENLERSAMAPLFDQRDKPVTYVSRAGMNTCFGGEKYLESVLQQCGVNVFQPERHGIKRQMQVYSSSRELIFAEGSAIHGTQLLGRSLASVKVLVRHPGERFCEAFLRPRARDLQYVECTRGIIHGETYRGLPAIWAGLPLLDEELLLDWLEACGLRAREYWDSHAFQHSEQEDIISWLLVNRDQPHTESSRQTILRQLETLGFAHLRGEAREIPAASD